MRQEFPFPFHRWMSIFQKKYKTLAKFLFHVYNNFCSCIATVAQPVEQLIRNQQVRGSNPLGSFQLKNDPLDHFLICMATKLMLRCRPAFVKYSGPVRTKFKLRLWLAFTKYSTQKRLLQLQKPLRCFYFDSIRLLFLYLLLFS